MAKAKQQKFDYNETAAEPMNVVKRVLIGIGLLALAAYTGWIIYQAPEITGLTFAEYRPLLQEQMGVLGMLVYLLIHGALGGAMVIFTVLCAWTGINRLLGTSMRGLQVVSVVLLTLAITALLHMGVAYVDVKQNLMLGLNGNGGGLIGAVVSMLALKALGTAGTYICILCLALAGLILLAISIGFGKKKEGPGALEQLKDKVMHFIFIEEDEPGFDKSAAKKEKKAKQEVKAEAKTASREPAVQKQRNTAGREGAWSKLKNFFVESEEVPADKPRRERYTGADYVVIPKEKPVVINNLSEIHKSMNDAPRRVGLSPREPYKPEFYGIQDSVEDFHKVVGKRMGTADPEEPEVQEETQQEELQRLMQERLQKKNAAPQPKAETEPKAEVPAKPAAPVRKKQPKTEEIPDETEQQTLDLLPETVPDTGYQLPPVELLDINEHAGGGKNTAEIMQNVERLEKTLNDFGVKGKIADVSCGPAITRYEFQPAAGVKVSKIVNLSDDIALSMAVAGVRIEAPIPGKAAVGIEIPNKSTSMVGLRELIESDAFQNSKSKLTVALGKDISGEAIVADLAKMPHLLIAGSTGSGKSVCMNTLINSVLYKAKPDEVKFLMVDPKKVELGNYNGIPHLIAPVVTDAKKAASALRWAVQEMDRRYEVFAASGSKDMKRFNQMAEERRAQLETEEEKAAVEIMPYIVVLIDELADLMMVAPADVEDAICRLAQLARAAGIHLVVATQRPSVDVITGIIKANMPSRIAFAVSSQIDSRTILDMGGAEKLLGRGDMLFHPTGMPKPQRVQGAYVSDDEIERIVEAVKAQAQPTYNEEIGTAAVNTEEKGGSDQEEWDDLIPEATRLFIENGQASISLLQRRFRVGYTRAARIVDQMEQRGLVGPYEGSKPRQIRITMSQYEDMLEQGEL